MKFQELTTEELKVLFDNQVQTILYILQPYKDKHPNGQITISEVNVLSIRIRVIDPDFEHMTVLEREDEIWPLLKKLHDEIYLNLSMVLLLSPKEAETSWANFEFENPIMDDSLQEASKLFDVTFPKHEDAFFAFA